MDILPNEPVTAFDIYSRFELELRVFQKDSGRMAIDFLVPGSIRLARGTLR